jgi:LmbE family N-acetylglucosaminyl deacetylase
MIEALAGAKAGSPISILCLGAHPDDIEIGCGGTLLRLLQENGACSVDWVVFSGTPARRLEATRSARRFLAKARASTVQVKEFRDSFFPYQGLPIKEAFESLKTMQPDLIFTHWRGDAHQDHRLLCELTWNTFRSHRILEYEIPKYDGDLGRPNVYVSLSRANCQKKVRLIMQAFPSQHSKRWFTEETFLAMLRLRGIEANGKLQYAEAFYGHKLVW